MDNQQIRLSIIKQKDKGNGNVDSSSTELSFGTLEELQRVLSLAGVKSDITPVQSQEEELDIPLIDTEEECVGVECEPEEENSMNLKNMFGDCLEYEGIEEMQDFENTFGNKKSPADMSNKKTFNKHYGHNSNGMGATAEKTTKNTNYSAAKYGDNALTESKIENIAILLEEKENDSLKSAIKKITNNNYNLSESEITNMASVFINLLNDKSNSRFNSVKTLINSITESNKMFKKLKEK